MKEKSFLDKSRKQVLLNKYFYRFVLGKKRLIMKYYQEKQGNMILTNQ